MQLRLGRGPARRDDQADLGLFTPGGRGDGRPIWVTDLRDPTRPRVFPEPIDLLRNDGLPHYAHDVDVDDHGIAWVSGRGGVRGYATQGRWRDPLTDTMRNARPWDPILAAAWYGQGLRLIDASNARNLRQVGYYYVTGTDPDTNPSSLSWDVAWRGELIYLFDMDRGIEILRLAGGPREPALRVDPLAAQPVSGLTPGSLVCPLFVTPGQS